MKNAIHEGSMPRSHRSGDPALPGAKRRPCARCGKRFQPTKRRRMLCKGCFTSVDASGMDA